MLARLKQHLHNHNRAAQLHIELDELAIERRYLQQWQESSHVQATFSLEKYGLTPRKTADLMAYLAHLDEQRIHLKDRIELLFKFRIFRTKPFAEGPSGRIPCFADALLRQVTAGQGSRAAGVP